MKKMMLLVLVCSIIIGCKSKRERAMVYYKRGHERESLRDYDGAKVDYDTAIMIDNSFADAYCGRAGIKSRKNENSASLSDINKAIALKPDNIYYYVQRAAVKIDSGDFAGAMEDCNMVLQQNPKYNAAYRERAITEMNMGNDNDALTDFNTGLELDPNDTFAYYDRAVLKYNMQDYRGAFVDLSQVIKLNDRLSAAWDLAGNALGELGEYYEATRLVRRAAIMHRTDPDSMPMMEKIPANLLDE